MTCSPSMMQYCVTSLIVWHRSTSCTLDRDICRRGSTPTAVLLVDTVVVENGVIVELACDADRRAWIAATQTKLKLFQAKKDEYWLTRVRDDGRSTKLWQTLSSLLGRDKSSGQCSTFLTADGFAKYFSRQVADIRAATDGIPPPNTCVSATAMMEVFQSVTEDDVRRVIMASPSKSSSLDPIPTFLLKEVIDILLPYITALINASLQQG